MITSGCDWYINSAEHGYCFWNYAKDLDEPVPDKEICQLLCITQIQLRETFNSAIQKLRDNKDSPIIKEFIETVLDFSTNRKYDDDHLVDEGKFTLGQLPTGATGEPKTDEEIIDEIECLKKGKVKKTRGRKSLHGMPLHKDGKKVDLYGLYSDPNKQKEAQEKMKKKEKE